MPRPEPLWLHLGAIAARLRRARALAVASDYDGTLAPIVRHPSRARMPARTRAVLARLARLPRARVAILSGRPLGDVADRVGIPGVFLAGVAGLETRDAAGRRRVHVPAGRRLPAGLRVGLQRWCDRFPGAWLEDKGLSLALHYRGVAPGRRAALAAGVRRLLGPHAARAGLVHGKRVFEVMPAVAEDKATALGRWLGPRRAGAGLFYFGDDANDEPAHARVRRLGGVAVAVGRPRSRAAYALASPEDVGWFLEWLAREWAARAARRGDGRR